MALGFAVAPVAGQNFGARKAERVLETFKRAALMAAGIMALFTIPCIFAGEAMIRFFSSDPAVIAVGAEYLRLISWSLAAGGVVFVNGSIFQAMGNTIPPLIASFARILVVAIPAILLSRMAGFELRWIWYLSVAATILQFDHEPAAAQAGVSDPIGVPNTAQHLMSGFSRIVKPRHAFVIAPAPPWA